MKYLKKINNIENLLLLFVIICPLLDVISFIFRKKFQTNISISTFIRPIIPIVVYIILFLKLEQKDKKKNVAVIIIYLVYFLIHIYIYSKLQLKCSYGTIIHEAQYMVNYTFMILNLYLFIKIFNKNNYKKLQKVVLISMSIYIFSIYLSIITKTSSTTYIEGMGFKGWFESGNSISSILLLGVFIILSFILNLDKCKLRTYGFILLILIGVYMTTLIGTRVGLLGFILAIICFIIGEISVKLIQKSKINKKLFLILITSIFLVVILVIFSGSATIKRRKHLNYMETTIVDNSTGKVSNLTGDLTELRNKIINNQLEDNYMSIAQQKSILELYNYAQKYDISNTNTRMQQFIYHISLVKNQCNVVLILFGNGYLINTNELVWEMEFPAIIVNFGITGFVLYMLPFIIICLRALIKTIKNIKNINNQIVMLICASILSFVLSTLSGYTFFNSSSMIIIIIVNTLLRINIESIEHKEVNNS
ncbi:MAG: hypothetical protein E7313_01400 [Clostridiales bacterium]|nr:hypothetical protein [Clostridiales bacterium]